MYKQDDYRDKILRTAALKYHAHNAFSDNVKNTGVQRYKSNSTYRSNCKQKSTQMYKMNEKYRKAMKKRSIDKYRLNRSQREKVRKSSIFKYNTKNQFRKELLDVQKMKYKTDEKFRLKSIVSSKQHYHSHPSVKRKKKESSTQRRMTKRIKLENEEEVVNKFRRNTARGPDFACCCCHRLLFENQVQSCDRRTYDKNEKTCCVADTCITDKYLHQCSTCSEICTKTSLWICYTCHKKYSMAIFLLKQQQTTCTLYRFPKNYNYV